MRAEPSETQRKAAEANKVAIHKCNPLFLEHAHVVRLHKAPRRISTGYLAAAMRIYLCSSTKG